MNLVCSSCIRSFPTDRMHVLPGWVEAPDAPGHFVITFRCHACYPAAIDDTARRVAAWDDATAADMAQFIDLWDLRDFLPELADANDREAATTLVQIVQASDGKALLPRVVPDPGIVEEAGFLERISIFATRMPRRALVIWCLWLVYLIFQCGYMTPEPWRPPGWATCAVTLLLPRVFEASFRTLTEHLSGVGVSGSRPGRRGQRAGPGPCARRPGSRSP